MDKIIVNCCKVIISIFICLALAGCEYINSKIDKDPATLKQQKCWSLKNQIAFDQNSINNSTNDLGKQRVTEVAKAMSEYKDNNCDQFEKM